MKINYLVLLIVLTLSSSAYAEDKDWNRVITDADTACGDTGRDKSIKVLCGIYYKSKPVVDIIRHSNERCDGPLCTGAEFQSRCQQSGFNRVIYPVWHGSDSPADQRGIIVRLLCQ